MRRSPPTTNSVPELLKKEGLFYAVAPEGIELPFIDVAHPAFRVDPAAVDTLLAEAASRQRSGAEMPAFMQAILSRVMPRLSILAREIAASRGGYLSGMGTYLVKLGPEMLGEGYASSLDRRIAGTILGLNARMRLRETATLLAESLAPRLEAEPGRPLALFDIAGGPAADCLNALLMLGRLGLLGGRRATLYVLDCDAEGPRFGLSCLGALSAAGAPLEGLDIEMRALPYDWNDASTLAELARAARGSVLAASSEGGLFEYGSDEAIVANLEALAAPGASMVGSLSGGEGLSGSLNAASGAAIRRWGGSFGDIEALAGRAGWRAARASDLPLGKAVALEHN
jgi:hypothetical protein